MPGYGLGGILIALGLIAALAVQDQQVGPVEVSTAGWIVAGVGLLIILLTALTWHSGRARKSEAVTTHADGSQTVHEQRSN